MDDVTAAVLAVVVSACVSAVFAAADKRGLRQPPQASKTFPTQAFDTALRTSGTDWFHQKLRCDKKTFLRIYELVHASMRASGPNCKHKAIKRVALTMNYLAQGGTMDQAATVLGISRSRASVYINETLDVLSTMAKRFVVMPMAEELNTVENGFYAITGFPDTVGAIDGTLIRIARPHDFEGWYCRKNFPAVNVQAIVDHQGIFRSISIRSGSNNDQSLWNGSGVRKRLSSLLPPGKHFVGDTGYKIWRHLLTPFPEMDALNDCRKRRYNYLHSKTRIAVECAFGRLKNRFRILLGKLEQKSADRVCKVILSCVVLHNLMVLLQDGVSITGVDPLLGEAEPVAEDAEDCELHTCHEQGLAKRDDIANIFVI